MLFRALGRCVSAGVAGVLALAIGAGAALLATCGPFTDTVNDAFCPFVLEVFYIGITTGTTPTTYDPTANVTRLQMAAFLSRTVDGVLRRGSQRAATNRFWIASDWRSWGHGSATDPRLIASDGTDAFVANHGNDTVDRIDASMAVQRTWSGVTGAFGVALIPGGAYVSGSTNPGRLYYLTNAGATILLSSVLGDSPAGIAFDGVRAYTANLGGSVSIVTPADPEAVTENALGFQSPIGALWDGANIWISDQGSVGQPGKLLKLNGPNVLQTVTLGVGTSPKFPVLDGSNIWVPNAGNNTVSVVRVSNGAILATLTGNGLDTPWSAAFDGERILVANHPPLGTGSFSLWKAADLSPIGSFSPPANDVPYGACSDGRGFWATTGAHVYKF